RSWRRLSCTSMSDQADSERTRNCTRLLYIAIRKMPNRTMTARTIQAMQTLLGADSKGRYHTKEKVSKFEVSKLQGFRVPRLLRVLRNTETLKLCLLSGSVVSAAGANLQIFFHGGGFDSAVAPVGVEVGRLVGDVILAAQFLFNGGERVRDVFHLVGEEGAAASGGSEVLENFVAAQDQAAVVGRDGIDENFGALGHFNGLGARVFALIVFAVAQDDDGFANGTIGMFAQQSFLARLINRIIERGAAAIVQALHSGGE